MIGSFHRWPARGTLLASIVLVLFFTFLHQLYLCRAHPDALYMDSLRLLWQLNRAHAGEFSLFELWRQGGGHRGLIYQAVLMANIKFFSLNVLLANRLTGVVIGAIVMLIITGFMRSLRRAGAPGNARCNTIALVFSLLTALLCFSLEGFELLTLDLGLANWLKNLLFIGYYVLLSRQLEPGNASAGMPSWLALSMCGFLIVLFAGMGWSYAFVASVLCVQAAVLWSRRHQLRFQFSLKISLPALFALCGLLVYIIAGGGVGVRGGATAPAPGLFSSLMLIPFALGSAWASRDGLSYFGLDSAVSFWLGAVTAVIALLALVARLRRGVESGSLLPLYLLAYGGMTAISVSFARGEGGPAAVMASRYFMDVILFLIGTTWLSAEWLMVDGEHSRPWLAGAGIACAILLSLQVASYSAEWKLAPYRAENFKAMNAALLQGVPDQASADMLQSPLQHAQGGAKVMRDLGLAVFKSASGRLCSNLDIIRPSGWNQPEPDGIWSEAHAQLQIPACSCELIADVHLPTSFTARSLVLADPAATGPTRLELLPGASQAVHISPSAFARIVRIDLSSDTVPARDFPGQADVRKLGAWWTGLRFACR